MSNSKFETNFKINSISLFSMHLNNSIEKSARIHTQGQNCLGFFSCQFPFLNYYWIIFCVMRNHQNSSFQTLQIARKQFQNSFMSYFLLLNVDMIVLFEIPNSNECVKYFSKGVI